jgi:hypothetical protein
MAANSEKKPKLDEVMGRVARVTRSLLEDGAEPSQVASALTSVAADMGLQSAMLIRRKPDRHRRSSNVAGERQHSSTSRDVSALRAAFRRCQSDSQFRSRFIANRRNP